MSNAELMTIATVAVMAVAVSTSAVPKKRTDTEKQSLDTEPLLGNTN